MTESRWTWRGFEHLMEQQRERGRAARKDDVAAPELQLAAGTSSRFVGYHDYEREGEILAASRKDGDAIAIVVAETPFYPEGGGTDRRSRRPSRPSRAPLSRGGRYAQGRRRDRPYRPHPARRCGRIRKGAPRSFESRIARGANAANAEPFGDSHPALRAARHPRRSCPSGRIAGRAGSPALRLSSSGRDCARRPRNCRRGNNPRIRENAEVRTDEMDYDEAIKAGALAFFGDNTATRVRVIRMGDFLRRAMRRNACRSHRQNRDVQAGSGIGIAAGVRRVEAFTRTGRARIGSANGKRFSRRSEKNLGARDAQALERLEKLVQREKELEKKLRAMEQKLASGGGASGAASDEKSRSSTASRW